MTSFQISISPSRRAAGRFISRVRRSIQRALAEEHRKSGVTQSDIARTIGVHRSVINRELRGQKDITLGRVAELAWALGRTPSLELPERTPRPGTNTFSDQQNISTIAKTTHQTVSQTVEPMRISSAAAV